MYISLLKLSDFIIVMNICINIMKLNYCRTLTLQSYYLTSFLFGYEIFKYSHLTQTHHTSQLKPHLPNYQQEIFAPSVGMQ